MAGVEITDEDRARIAGAIRKAEAGTEGEIVCVVMRAASDYRSVPLLWAALAALALPWPLINLMTLQVRTVYTAQLIAFIALAIILSFANWRMRLVLPALRRRRAAQAAREQFYAQGMHRTRARSGILIFLAEAERYAEIIVDDGIAAKVDTDFWKEEVRQLTGALRAGRAVDGLMATIEACGALLAREVPRQSEPKDELPDRLVLL